MIKFVSFLHLQNRHEKHTKIGDNYNSQISQQNNIKSTHKNIKKFLQKTCDKTSNAIKEKPPLAGYLKFKNDEQNETRTSTSTAPAAPTVAAAAKCCCTSEARQFCRCSGNDRCAAGTSCATTRCCCCSAASGCSTARFRCASTLCGGCCTATAARRIPFCRLSTGICPIRQQFQWAHDTTFSRISNTFNCSDCCTAGCLNNDRQQTSTGEEASCASSCCNNYKETKKKCADCCCTCTVASSLQPTAKHPTAFKLSSITPQTSLTPFQLKLKLLTGTATNCC